jgi:hypothetical protein
MRQFYRSGGLDPNGARIDDRAHRVTIHGSTNSIYDVEQAFKYVRGKAYLFDLVQPSAGDIEVRGGTGTEEQSRWRYSPGRICKLLAMPDEDVNRVKAVTQRLIIVQLGSQPFMVDILPIPIGH